MSMAPLPAKQGLFLEELAGQISRNIQRHDTEHAIFHGCVDWHSAVHGHWALFRLQNRFGVYADQAQAAAASLSVEGLDLEIKLLVQNPEFEMPYGRAWFLRLAMEHETWAVKHDAPNRLRLRGLAELCANSLIQYYRDKLPSPNSSEYQNASWALTQLYDYLQHTQGRDLALVQSWITRYFVGKPPALSFRDDQRTPEFFSVFGNWAYLLAKTQGPRVMEEQGLGQLGQAGSLHPVLWLNGSDHHLGMNWSRAWAVKALARRATQPEQAQRLEKAWQAHIDAGMQLHTRMRANYGAYGHWVPQFAVYGLTE